MKFTTNIGSTDAMIRIAFGAILLLLTAFGVIGLWGLLGLVALGTAFVKFCPAYAILGLRTCKPQQ
ncbi:MAG: DUF2892 domain-containing protein [Paracoccaceae bacterium]